MRNFKYFKKNIIKNKFNFENLNKLDPRGEELQEISNLLKKNDVFKKEFPNITVDNFKDKNFLEKLKKSRFFDNLNDNELKKLNKYLPKSNKIDDNEFGNMMTDIKKIFDDDDGKNIKKELKSKGIKRSKYWNYERLEKFIKNDKDIENKIFESDEIQDFLSKFEIDMKKITWRAEAIDNFLTLVGAGATTYLLISLFTHPVCTKRLYLGAPEAKMASRVYCVLFEGHSECKKGCMKNCEVGNNCENECEKECDDEENNEDSPSIEEFNQNSSPSPSPSPSINNVMINEIRKELANLLAKYLKNENSDYLFDLSDIKLKSIQEEFERKFNFFNKKYNITNNQIFELLNIPTNYFNTPIEKAIILNKINSINDEDEDRRFKLIVVGRNMFNRFSESKKKEFLKLPEEKQFLVINDFMNQIKLKINKKEIYNKIAIKEKSFFEKYMIVIIIVVLLILGVVGYFIFGGKSNSSDGFSMDF